MKHAQTHFRRVAAPALALLALAAGACKKKEPSPAPAGGAPAPTPAAVVPAGPGSDLPAASRSGHFAAVNAHLDLGGHVYAYVDVDGELEKAAGFLKKMLGAAAEAGAPLPPFDIDLMQLAGRFGIGQLKAAGLSSIRDGDQFRNRAFIHLPGGREGIFKVGGGDPHPFESHRLAPAESVLVYEADIDLSVVLETALAVADDLGGTEMRAQVEAALSEPLAPIAPTPTVADFLRRGKTKLMVIGALQEGTIQFPGGPATVPEFDLLVSLDAMGWLFDAYKGMAAHVEELTLEDGEAFEVLHVSTPLPGDLGRYKPVLLRDKASDRLSLTLRKSFFDACQAQTGGVAEVEDFKLATRNLPAEGNEFLYVSQKLSAACLGVFDQTSTDVPPPARKVVTKLLEFVGGKSSTGIASVTVNQPDGIAVAGNAGTSFKAVAVAPVGFVLPWIFLSRSVATESIEVHSFEAAPAFDAPAIEAAPGDR